jgi:3-oxoacyl-[acyl-carrier-protein] synthase III
MYPPTHDMVDRKLQFVKMEGQQGLQAGGFGHGGRVRKVLTEAGYKPDDVDLLSRIRQLRIIEAGGGASGLPREKAIVTGTSTATPARPAFGGPGRGQPGRTPQEGDLVLMPAFARLHLGRGPDAR